MSPAKAGHYERTTNPPVVSGFSRTVILIVRL